MNNYGNTCGYPYTNTGRPCRNQAARGGRCDLHDGKSFRSRQLLGAVAKMGPAAYAPVAPLTTPDEDAVRAEQAGRVARRGLADAEGALRDISSVRGIVATDGYRDCEDYVIPELHHPVVLLLKNRLSGRIRKAKAAVTGAEASLAAATAAGGDPRHANPAWMSFSKYGPAPHVYPVRPSVGLQDTPRSARVQDTPPPSH